MDTRAPQIIVRQSRADNDHWTVELDCGTAIKLRTSELTSYRQFRMQSVLQASRLFPPMRDQDWLNILAEAMRNAEITLALGASTSFSSRPG